MGAVQIDNRRVGLAGLCGRANAARAVKASSGHRECPDTAAAEAFYRGVLGLDLVMDRGWLRAYASASEMRV
jgi:hypothetical protein